MNNNEQWMREKVAAEDGCYVSVGGMICDIEERHNQESKGDRMTLLELLAGKGASPEAVEASIREMVQEETKTALAALQSGLADRETQGLDWVTATLLPALDKMLDDKIDRLLKVHVSVGFEEPKG